MKIPYALTTQRSPHRLDGERQDPNPCQGQDLHNNISLWHRVGPYVRSYDWGWLWITIGTIIMCLAMVRW